MSYISRFSQFTLYKAISYNISTQLTRMYVCKYKVKSHYAIVDTCASCYVSFDDIFSVI